MVEELPTNVSVQVEERDPKVDDIDCEVAELNEDVEDLEDQLERNVAKCCQFLTYLKLPCKRSSISSTKCICYHSHCYILLFEEFYILIDDAFVNKIAQVVTEYNVFLKFTSDEGSLSTAKRRKSYISSEFPLVTPVEFVLENDKQTVAYVPILKMLQTLLSNREVLEMRQLRQRNTNLTEMVPSSKTMLS